MKQKFDRELAESVLEVSIRANRHVIDELRGDDRVCQTIMEPEINKIKAETKENDILCAVKCFRDLGVNISKIKELLVKNYSLSYDEAEKYLHL